MSIDRSEGWDEAAQQFMSARSRVGANLVAAWAKDKLPPRSAIVDVGCGSGAPIAETLIAQGFAISGIDASPKMIAAFRARFPDVPSACEAAQDSSFFGRRFDAAVSIGLLFLLSGNDQVRVIEKVAKALVPRGRFLFTAPQDECEWHDAQTGRPSVSLGEDAYRRHLESSGLTLVDRYLDGGENNYFEALRSISPDP